MYIFVTIIISKWVGLEFFSFVKVIDMLDKMGDINACSMDMYWNAYYNVYTRTMLVDLYETW